MGICFFLWVFFVFRYLYFLRNWEEVQRENITFFIQFHSFHLSKILAFEVRQNKTNTNFCFYCHNNLSLTKIICIYFIVFCALLISRRFPFWIYWTFPAKFVSLLTSDVLKPVIWTLVVFFKHFRFADCDLPWVMFYAYFSQSNDLNVM